MEYYHDPKNAKSYAAMCEGYDASEQLGIFYKALPDGATVLELGSGPGNDLELLSTHYEVTGSDSSPAFIHMLHSRFPHLPIVRLDAANLEINETYNAIYSNKVLHHLSDEELIQSFAQQAKILTKGGMLFHLIWARLDQPEGVQDMVFEARDIATMTKIMGSEFKLNSVQEFAEFEEGDSLALLAQKI